MSKIETKYSQKVIISPLAGGVQFVPNVDDAVCVNPSLGSPAFGLNFDALEIDSTLLALSLYLSPQNPDIVGLLELLNTSKENQLIFG